MNALRSWQIGSRNWPHENDPLLEVLAIASFGFNRGRSATAQGDAQIAGALSPHSPRLFNIDLLQEEREDRESTQTRTCAS